jgi:hypothetical protein
MINHSGMLGAEFGEDDIPCLGDESNHGSENKVEDSVGQRVSVDKVLGAGEKKEEQGGHRT